MLYKMIIINSNKLFSSVWSVVKTFLDKITLEKIHLYKKDYHQELEDLIGKERLPTFYDGEVDTPLYLNPGPWKNAIIEA